MSDILITPARTLESLLTLDRVPDFVPGRFSIWLFAKHQRKDGQKIEEGSKA
jgi:hypothetical protein